MNTQTLKFSALILLVFAIAFCQGKVNAQGVFTLPHDHSSLAKGGALAPSQINFDSLDTADFSNVENVFLGVGGQAADNFGIYDSVDSSSFVFETTTGGTLGFTVTDGTDTNVLNEESIVITNGTNSAAITLDVRGAGTPGINISNTAGNSNFRPTQLSIDNGSNTTFLGSGLFTLGISGGATLFSSDITGDGEIFLSGTSPDIVIDESDASANSGRWLIGAGGNSFSIFTQDDAESTTDRALQFTRSGITINTLDLCDSATPCGDITLHTDELLITDDAGVSGTSITPTFYQSGTFQASTVGCTVEYSIDVTWQKVGDVATLHFLVPAIATCTSDSTVFEIDSSALFPSSLLPSTFSTTGYQPVAEIIDNGVTSWGSVAVFSSGDISFRFEGGAFTSSGSKGFDQRQFSTTYMVK